MLAALAAGTMNSSAQLETLLGDQFEGVTGEISAGFDTQYFYRGLWFGDDTAWTNIALSKEICENLTGTVNVFYTDVIENDLDYSEANFGANLSWDSGAGTFDLSFVHFQFFDGFAGDFTDSTTGLEVDSVGTAADQRDASEFALTYSTEDFYGFSAHLTAAWDVRIDAGYLEAGIAQSIDLAGFATLDLSALLGYSLEGYYTFDDAENGFTHALFAAELPIALKDNVTLTPYVAANLSLEARDGTNSGVDRDGTEVFYGVNLAVSF